MAHRNGKNPKSCQADGSVPDCLQVALVRFDGEEFLAFRENGNASWRRYFRLDELRGIVDVVHVFGSTFFGIVLSSVFPMV